MLVNNAATEADRMCRADEMPVSELDRLYRANARSLVLMTRAALPSLRETRGVVITAGSTAGVSGIPNMAIYGATKAFVPMTLAISCGSMNIANQVCTVAKGKQAYDKRESVKKADAKRDIDRALAARRRKR